MTAFATRQDKSTLANPKIYFGAPGGPPEAEFQLTDRDYVRRVKEELAAVGKPDPSRAGARS
jgi:hypothetical protein